MKHFDSQWVNFMIRKAISEHGKLFVVKVVYGILISLCSICAIKYFQVLKHFDSQWVNFMIRKAISEHGKLFVVKVVYGILISLCSICAIKYFQVLN